MKATYPVSVEIKVTPWVRVDGKWDHAPWIGAYRIWVMHDPLFNRWWQCHEWERNDGNKERSADGWIASVARSWNNAIEPEPGDEPPHRT